MKGSTLSPEECNCNEIKIKLLDINAKRLNKAIFGRYKVSSKVVNNRETYTSVIGAYMVWFNGKDWNLGYRKDLGSEKSLISLRLKNTPNFNSARTFAWNASGINFWDTKSEKIQVKVTCSSKIGKIFPLLRYIYSSFFVELYTCRLVSFMWRSDLE